MGWSLLVWSLSAMSGCGGKNETTFTEPEPAPEPSRTLAILSEPESLDAVCRLIGVQSLNGAAPGADAAATCSQVVEQCRSAVGGFLEQVDDTEAAATGEAAPPGAVPEGDLQALLGCPVTVTELDGCVAQILERSRDTYAADVSCESVEPPEVDPAFLFTVPACFGVVLRCPELLSLGQQLEAMP
jgi:hypothetical protein